LIHFHEVQKTVGDRQLFNQLTLFLPKASYTLIKGEPQSGKTTLLRMIMAYEAPDQGTLQVDGIDIGSIPPQRIAFLRRQIGLIETAPNLLEDRTAVENISVPLQLAGFDQNVIQQRIDDVLDATDLTSERNTRADKLTTTFRHRVAVARAMVHKPSIILADDPLHDLDVDSAALTARLINSANDAGATVVITGQDNAYLQHCAGINTVKLLDGSLQNNEFKQSDKH